MLSYIGAAVFVFIVCAFMLRGLFLRSNAEYTRASTYYGWDKIEPETSRGHSDGGSMG